MSSLQIGNVTQQVPTSVDAYATSVGTALNVSTPTLIKASPGRLVRISVLVAGAVGSANDAATVATATASNQVFVIPATVGMYQLDFPCLSGVVVLPGAGQVLAIAYY